MKVNGRVGLRDLRPLSQQELELATNICGKIRRIVDARNSYIQAHNIDRDFALPDANWKEGPHNDFYEAYRLVVSGDYEVINRLKLYAQAFTGYQLISFSWSKGKRSVNPILPDFDE